MRSSYLFIALVCVSSLVGCDALRPIPSPSDAVRVVEVSVFEGGYGIEWHKRMAEKFNAEHVEEGIRIDLWGDPRNADIIKPRLLRGDPPDLILNERLPIWQLVQAKKILPFTNSLKKNPYGAMSDETSWEDTFATGMLDMFKSDGEVYAIPAAYGAWLCWYDERLFREHGWKTPDTWEEFLALCAEIKEAGIAPLTLQGKYANFYAWNTYVSLVHRVGGLEAINRINALEEQAFSNPNAIRAAELFQDLFLTQFQQGALAMTHTESQLQFVNNHAAMIFCGIWLENEMKASTPPGFEMRSFRVPPVSGGKGNPALLHGQGMEFLFVPKDARYPDIAFEFARYLVSPLSAPDMARSIGVISPLKGATPTNAVSPTLQSALGVIENSTAIYNVRVRLLFPEWTAQVMNTAIGDLLRGEITPEEFGRLLDEGIALSVANAKRAIPPYVPYDPVALGESI